VLHLRRCNNLEDCPDVSMCPNLETLELGGPTSLLQMPPNVAKNPKLKTLNLRRTPLIFLAPDVSNCRSLERLDLFEVPTTNLPRGVTALPSSCTVAICAKALGDYSRQMFDEVYEAPEYAGPNILGAAPRAAALEVLGWRRELAQNKKTQLSPETQTAWSSIDTEDTTRSFKLLLNRLRDTSEYRNKVTVNAFRQRVCDFLDNIENDPELQIKCVAMAEGAVKGCADRVAYGLTLMELACAARKIETRVENGEFDHNPQALMNLGWGMHRHELLEDMAQRKWQQNNQYQLNELRLGRLVRFSKEFDLPVQMNSMLYDDLAEISQKNEQQGTAFLQGPKNIQDNARLVKFLNQWAPADALLSRQDPQRFAAVQASIQAEQTRLHEAHASLDTTAPDYGHRSKVLMHQFMTVVEKNPLKTQWIKSLLE
jgi:hypothetical protein